MEILITEKNEEYELLDSGEGEKLERFGKYVLRRPENQAIWKKSLSEESWKKADATFSHGQKSGRWQKNQDTSDNWNINFSSFKFGLELLPSKHVGLFPEQSQNWKWLAQLIKKEVDLGKKVKVLNLFANTGGASLSCSRAGAEVVHLDSSKFSVDMAKKNFKLNSMEDNPVRFIVDDVRKFVEREIKRGNQYDVIVMDPPVYGKGTNDKVWKIEEDLVPLLARLKELVSKNPVAILLNGYASVYSSLSYKNTLNGVVSSLGGELVFGELALEDSSGKLLPSGIFAKWGK